jgi:hypothetical protein
MSLKTDIRNIAKATNFFDTNVNREGWITGDQAESWIDGVMPGNALDVFPTRRTTL